MNTDTQEMVKVDEECELLQLVTFKLDTEEFGIDILKVQEIIRIMNIVKIPNSPSYIEGVINLRGKVISIVNLRKKLKLPLKENNIKTRVIVVELSGKTVGFIVDEVNEVLRITGSIIESPPEITVGIDSDYITSVGKLKNRIIILLDIEKLINKNKIKG